MDRQHLSVPTATKTRTNHYPIDHQSKPVNIGKMTNSLELNDTSLLSTSAPLFNPLTLSDSFPEEEEEDIYENEKFPEIKGEIPLLLTNIETNTMLWGGNNEGLKLREFRNSTPVYVNNSTKYNNLKIT
jgi:hypothetical protein